MTSGSILINTLHYTTQKQKRNDLNIQIKYYRIYDSQIIDVKRIINKKEVK